MCVCACAQKSDRLLFADSFLKYRSVCVSGPEQYVLCANVMWNSHHFLLQWSKSHQFGCECVCLFNFGIYCCVNHGGRTIVFVLHAQTDKTPQLTGDIVDSLVEWSLNKNTATPWKPSCSLFYLFIYLFCVWLFLCLGFFFF